MLVNPQNKPQTSLNFGLGTQLDRAVIEGQSVDDHHIFPQGWLKDNQLDGQLDTVLNHTLIDKITNIRISKSSPKTYLNEMKLELPQLSKILASHGLPSDADSALWQNDYAGFLAWRQEYLASELARVTGAP